MSEHLAKKKKQKTTNFVWQCDIELRKLALLIFFLIGKSTRLAKR